MTSGAYWLGVATLPSLALVAVIILFTWIKASVWLDEWFGVTFQLRWTRDVAEISDYTLTYNIWWERSFGPIFAGGWYREPRLATRWVAVGRPGGPSFMVLKRRNLEAVDR